MILLILQLNIFFKEMMKEKKNYLMDFPFECPLLPFFILFPHSIRPPHTYNISYLFFRLFLNFYATQLTFSLYHANVCYFLCTH